MKHMRNIARFLASALGRTEFKVSSLASITKVQAAEQQADEDKGWVWDIVIMKFGEFQNAAGDRGYRYVFPKEAAEASLEVFNGAKVYSNSEGDRGGHKSDPNTKVPKDIIGVITDVKVNESELVGKLNLYRGTGVSIRENLLGAVKDNIPVPYELSIDAYGPSEEDVVNKVVKATSYARVSVDLVERGAAGGQIVRMAASHIIKEGEVAMSPTRKGILWLFALLFPTYLEAKSVDYLKVDENELFTHLLEADKPQGRMKLPDGIQLSETVINEQVKRFRDAALKTEDDILKQQLSKLDKFLESMPTPTKPPDPPAPPQPAKVVALADDPTFKAMEARLAESDRRFCESLLSNRLGESKLPVPLQEAVREMFTDPQGKIKVFQESDLTLAIDRTRKTYAKMQGSKVDNKGLDVRPGQDELDKIQLGLDGFFLSKSIKPLSAQESKEMLKGVQPYRSFKAAYVDYTGDVDVTGDKNKSRRFLESLQTGDWSEVVASAMNKRLVRDYNGLELNAWREIVDIVPLGDFKTQRRIRYGGYANLPTVGQGNPYAPLVSPTDEEATYTPAKKGGTEDLTLELIKNDDVGAVAKIPQRMARAAAQTLHEFVFDFIRPGVNPVIYDGVVLYHAGSHVNTGTVALAADAIAFNAARLRLKKQTMKDNLKPLGLRAGFLFVPSDLETIAYGLTMPAAGNANLVPTFAQSLGVKPVTIDYWTDVTDWVMAAKRQDGVGLEMGFLDGKEDPEMFVSDLANVGSWFTNDKITYKIRFIFGGVVTDYRFFDGSIVAG